MQRPVGCGWGTAPVPPVRRRAGDGCAVCPRPATAVARRTERRHRRTASNEAGRRSDCGHVATVWRRRPRQRRTGTGTGARPRRTSATAQSGGSRLATALLLAVLASARCASALWCISCGSIEYQQLWHNEEVQRSKPRPMIFHPYCNPYSPSGFEYVPKKKCKAGPCVTVMEPRTVGGIVLNGGRPELFLRGCAEDVFTDRPPGSYVTNRPAEIAYLLENAHCEHIPASEIWHYGDEAVAVCSCFTDNCNVHKNSAVTSTAPALRPTHAADSITRLCTLATVIALLICTLY